MIYNFFDLNEVTLDEWDKVYFFLINKADSFKIQRIVNYTELEEIYPNFTNDNNTLNSYSISNNLTIGDKDLKKQSWEKLFLLSLERTDMFKMKLPIIEPFESLIQYMRKLPYLIINNIFMSEEPLVTWTKQFDSNLIEGRNPTENQKAVEIYGNLTEECKSIIRNSQIIDIMQLDNMPEWRLHLLDSNSYRCLFSNWKDSVCSNITIEELELLEEKSITMEQIESSQEINTTLGTLNAYTCTNYIDGTFTEESKRVFYNVPYFRKAIPNLNQLHFSEIKFYKGHREILYNDTENRLLCLSDKELQDIITNLDIDISNWDIYKQKDTYTVPNDFFILELPYL